MALVAIGYVAKLFGVTAQTIRNWEAQGRFETVRTVGNHRRFELASVEKAKGIVPVEEKKTVA